jgi:hypothetical protein
MSKPVAVGIAALAVAGATFVPVAWRSRSVRPVTALPPASAGFDREQSAGLFVGIGVFTPDKTLPTLYAVDDAVDLAYVFAMDRRVGLVPPHRIVLALSGEPKKPESKRKLKELLAAGARREPATETDILRLLRSQAALAGADGIFVAFVATHGYVHDGEPYLLGSSSLFGDHDTVIPAAKFFQIAGDSAAARSLIFVDACRERAEAGVRSGAPDVETVAPLLAKMKRVRGQVIFYAAAANQAAYDDPESQNGVFTRAVIDGLGCNAQSKAIVTAASLHESVKRRVRDWIRKHKGRDVDPATQISYEGDSDEMPLAQCPPPPPRENPTRVSVDGTSVTVFDQNDKELRRYDHGEPVVHAETADLDADGQSEVIIGVRAGISAFDRAGRSLWSSHEDGLTLHGFVTGQLARDRTRRVVALWHGKRGSRVSIIDSHGERAEPFEHEDQWRQVLIDRPTTRHMRRVIVSSARKVCVLEPKSGRWCSVLTPQTESLVQMEIRDVDADDRRDIVVTTASGDTFAIDFDKGKTLEHVRARPTSAAQMSVVTGRRRK